MRGEGGGGESIQKCVWFLGMFPLGKSAVDM